MVIKKLKSMASQPLPPDYVFQKNMSIHRKSAVQMMACRFLAGLLTICSPVMAAQTSIVTRSDHIGVQNESYRNIGNVERPVFSSVPTTLPIDTCAIVDHIEQIGMIDEANNFMNARIRGMIALPAGQHTNRAFYTSIDIPANQGYRPPQRNIAQTGHFRIYLSTAEGNSHVVTQSILPRFLPGDFVLLQNSGVLEMADCMHKAKSK